MQLFLLALIVGLFLHDSPMRPTDPVGGGALMLGLLIGPKLALCGFYWLGCVLTRHGLAQRHAARAMHRLEWLTMFNRTALLALYALDLWAGALIWVRQGLGDLVLVDELVLLSPTLGCVLFTWWTYYPVDRRVREANLIRRLDAGLAVYPIWSRGQFVVAQLRHQMALLLVPLLLVFGWIETVEVVGRPDWYNLTFGAQSALTLMGAACVFLFAPLIIRHVWDTVPLPAGDIRDRLVRMCRVHRVRVRELLLWRTYGGMINAAVMGLIAPLRFILLSDALLEQVPRDQVEAVMAHELAHVRKHHMFWLLAAAGGTLGLLEMGARAVIDPAWLTPGGVGRGPGAAAGEATGAVAHWLDVLPAVLGPDGAIIALIGVAGLAWISLFGWLSRRFERQADAFAAVHLARQSETPWLDGRGQVRVDAASAETMIDALQQVAELNNVPRRKKSWRHGSIAWRQEHLRALIGQPVDDLAIDRVMQRIHIAALGAMGLALALYWMV